MLFEFIVELVIALLYIIVMYSYYTDNLKLKSIN
jgi:hypothetical protein